ncbi:uncharacterized protein si:ch211-188c16.1 isoform X3 [Boleophthalmus pectinirostris]|uniref:uncharacterized protein si:ch211-188c16.1 isoform X3 n=1 Tax=Boleophthalmus pectinirostris TaxID=150288 RepID=UPI00242CC7DC|nr:uncharacterized protein si:ch211-188c16.1 isoform X3 [Boleophthalmus pectinirostris]
MEEETSINFKALRAKFQEEALMTVSRASRPAVAGKPKHLPPPGGHCTSMVSNVHMAVDNMAPVVPRVFFRDGLRTSGGKRPISYPPRSPTSYSTNGDATSRHSLKDRQMPLVLPILHKEMKADQPSKKEHKLEVDGLQQTKSRKKGLLLPFKSKTAKASSEHGEEPTYADLTSRPASAPGELPSVEQTTDDRASLQGSEKTSECTVSSPDITVSPPSAEAHDSDSRLCSTLDKAKKRFSCRQVMSSIKPKSSSPESASKSRVSPTKSTHSTTLELPAPPPISPPLNLPNLIYISARPFSKGTTTFKSPLEKHFGKDKGTRPFARIGDPRPTSPQKKPLPEPWALGPEPTKPSRPPVVDLSSYMPHTCQDVSLKLNHTVVHERAPDNPTTVPVLNAPEFSDFDNSEIETAEENEAVQIATLDLKVPDPPLDATGSLDFAEPHSNWSDLTQKSELDLGNANIRSPNPPILPEPISLSEFSEILEQWSQREEPTIGPPCCTKEAVDCHSIPEDQGEHGNNFEFGVYQQEMHQTMCDNVYEDVENIGKFALNQSSHKQKGLKNPYAANHHGKEEPGHIFQRNTRYGGEPGYLSHSQINSKECQSPNTSDFKEQKKREKQRLEREKKVQKEREKKENEMKKKFKVTGAEEPMYHAKVTVASKVRKNDLPVKSGDTVSIIRTTNCPKGKWLARDANHKYGYISVMNVELNIKEMLELGKKAQAAGRGGNMEPDTISISSSSHPVLSSSFTDDSEEWPCEDETLSPSNESLSFPQQSTRIPEMSCSHNGTQYTLSDASLEDQHTQTRQEALQKLAIFFQHNKEELKENGDTNATSLEMPNLCDVEEPPLPEQEIDFTELELLPPPPLYADI